MSPVDGVTLDEAAHIVGWSCRTLIRHLEAGRLPARPANQTRRVSRADAEVLALGSRSSRVGFDEVSAYWVGATTAAELLGVGVARLNQLVAVERIPFEFTPTGGIYRREQLLTVANARDARWHGRPRTVGGR